MAPRSLSWLLLLAALGVSPPALAQITETVEAKTTPAVPTKTISFYNNSATETLYPVIQAPIMLGTPSGPVHDLWMQAQFNVSNVNTQIFNTTLLYKIFINSMHGVPPHTSVTITLPFYTQLLPTTASNLGKVDDQFIDWWNAMRLYVFDGKDALTAAYNYNNNKAGATIPPIPITPLSTAALPSCASKTTTCDPLLLKAYVVGFPTTVSAQLVEYTFASANGPPLSPMLSINLGQVNFNISAVDNIYLPAAIGAHGNTTAANAYLGTTQSVTPFRTALTNFTSTGAAWPYYVPAYYTAKNPQAALPTPPPGVKAYPLPQIPSADNLYTESFRDPPPAPPVLSSDTIGHIGQIGTLGRATLDLWEGCVGAANPDKTCQRIQTVNTFFTTDYHRCFPGKPVPSVESFLTNVYGWAQFPGCTPALVTVPGYAQALSTYCDLQYNFFDTTVPAAERFNPYVKLVQQTLASNAYAFSVDDAVSFKSLPGDGIVVTIGGPTGLVNQTQTPLPTATTYPTYCESGSGLGRGGHHRHHHNDGDHDGDD